MTRYNKSTISKLLIIGLAASAVAFLGRNKFDVLDIGSGWDTLRSGVSTIATSRFLEEDQISINPKLPFGDINLLVVSDVHSFVGGHPHEVEKNADYGDLLSFHDRLKEYTQQNNEGDLWLLNNGDILHGTGLAMDGNSTNLLPIIQSMPWDAMTMGRQEATYSGVLRDVSESIVPTTNYITSNVVWNATGEPYGNPYMLLKGSSSTLLVFGFLYDSVRSSETIQVLKIEDIIQQRWFRDALKENDYDAIVVMAHMDIDSPSINTIYTQIRSKVDPQMPIQFIAGRSHKRASSYGIGKDHYVHKLEPGGLMDTVGWVTIPKFETAQQYPPTGNGKALQAVFGQEFVNASKSVFKEKLGIGQDQEFLTSQGADLSTRIAETRDDLGLNQIVACPAHDYMRNISIFSEKSLWKLWREHVVRTEIFQKDDDRVMFVSKSMFRYDLLGSGKHDAMTLDDVVAIAPYMEKVIYVGDVPDWMIRRMNNTFNTFSHHHIIPDYVLAGDLDEVKTAESYKLYTHESDVPKIKTKLEKFNFHDFVLEWTGQRDTLYWLDYVRTAMPCTGKQKVEQDNFEIPYFFDPSELEEEATDGTLDFDGDNDEDDDDPEADVTWTIPPTAEYQGYIPGHGESHEVKSAVYENYKSKEEIEEEKRAKKAAEAAKYRGKKDLSTQLSEHKKTRKKLIKGFALMLAGLVLAVPVVCLVLQIMGKNNYYDDYNDGGAEGIYDQEEMRMLKRRRKRGNPIKPGESLEAAPFKEIEIV